MAKLSQLLQTLSYHTGLKVSIEILQVNMHLHFIFHLNMHHCFRQRLVSCSVSYHLASILYDCFFISFFFLFCPLSNPSKYVSIFISQFYMYIIFFFFLHQSILFSWSFIWPCSKNLLTIITIIWQVSLKSGDQLLDHVIFIVFGNFLHLSISWRP